MEKNWNKEKHFFLGLLCLIATNIFSPSQVLSQTTDLSLSADQILIDEAGTLTASGNVVIRHGSTTIKANSIVYDKNQDYLKVAEIREFKDGNKIKISANSGELNSSLKVCSGFIGFSGIFLIKKNITPRLITTNNTTKTIINESIN